MTDASLKGHPGDFEGSCRRSYLLTLATIFSSKACQIRDPQDSSRSTSQASTLVGTGGEAEEWMKCLLFKRGDLSLNLQVLM